MKDLDKWKYQISRKKFYFSSNPLNQLLILTQVSFKLCDGFKKCILLNIGIFTHLVLVNQMCGWDPGEKLLKKFKELGPKEMKGEVFSLADKGLEKLLNKYKNTRNLRLLGIIFNVELVL